MENIIITLTNDPWKILLSLSQKERQCQCYLNHHSLHITQHLSQRSTITHIPPSPLYWNVPIDYSEIFHTTNAGRKIILTNNEHNTTHTMRKALLSPSRNDGRKSYGREAIPLPLTHKLNPNHASWKTLLSPWEKARENIYHKRQTRAYLHEQTEITHSPWKTLLSLSQKQKKCHWPRGR